ncbi:MAG: ribonuclease P protein component [Prevotella sp.]|uniref:ribonuclease P protein component n=1 Tax=Prevotella sp. TaxID=59823 RepID=UPI002A30800B|nr:ribonuclease P protein component [Prevotella sp.]MDD7317276.1 ribonuclease P protein component [Prevotellaceae bacterium]MDY4019880.1 ribonuclease P protein component [Prevotella sp.]
MAITDAPKLEKKERISSKKTIDRLFCGGHSKAMSAFPLRAVYAMMPKEKGDAEAAMMVSVPKRMFKRAVKRNRVKRQVREAYRLNKHLLNAAFDAMPGKKLLVAFVWIDDRLHSSVKVNHKVRNILERIAERVQGGKVPQAGAKEGE